jgi:hypothetical protein
MPAGRWFFNGELDDANWQDLGGPVNSNTLSLANEYPNARGLLAAGLGPAFRRWRRHQTA